MDRAELEGWLRLCGTPGIGPVTGCKLLQAFDLPQAIFAQDYAALTSVLTSEQAKAVQTKAHTLEPLLETTLQWLDAGNGRHRVISLGDPLYPKPLLDIPDPPLMVYALAPSNFWESYQWPTQALAVVGSRNPSRQGCDNAHQFAHDLASKGIVVVSGLALGIDAAAHEGALAGAHTHPATIAVVGTGLDRVYPARHRALAQHIAEQGVLVSEYPLGTPPLPHHFPQRNRILCGLAQGTLVVEAALQSGSLITARLCVDQGKEVFAIPGSIHSPLSRGCHALIRQGAKLVESVQDIMEELPHWHSASPRRDADHTSLHSGTGHTADVPCPVMVALGHEAATLDQLQARTGWPTASLQVRLMELELESAVARLPGGSYQRIHRA